MADDKREAIAKPGFNLGGGRVKTNEQELQIEFNVDVNVSYL
jgi:hypothetical protein